MGECGTLRLGKTIRWKALGRRHLSGRERDEDCGGREGQRRWGAGGPLGGGRTRAHEVGREGDDASEAKAVVVAVPGGAIAGALDGVTDSGARRSSTPRTASGWAPRGILLERRVREIEDGRPHGEVPQHQLRLALRSCRRRKLYAEQPVVRGRGGTRGRRASQPGRRLQAPLRWPFRERLGAGGVHQARLRDRTWGNGPIPV